MPAAPGSPPGRTCTTRSRASRAKGTRWWCCRSRSASTSAIRRGLSRRNTVLRCGLTTRARRRNLAWCGVLPVHQLHPPVEVLDDGGARVHPVAAVEVGDAADVALRGGVDVAADHAVGAPLARVVRDRFLELEDEGERGLHL